jgi:ankyrin repeat protein
MLKHSRMTALVLIASALLVGPAAVARLAAADAPVAVAAMGGHTDEVRTLLKSGADVNAAQGDGMTALHWTALNGDLKTMDVLLHAGATTEVMTRVGAYTPLHLASSRGQAAAVVRLLDAGSKVGPFTATGVQPLHLAAQAGSADAVKALLDRGADINAKDRTHGRTPVVFATSQNRVDALKVLIARGADLRLTTAVVDYRERSAADTQVSTGGRPTPPADPDVVGRGGRGGGGPRPPSDIENIGKQGGFTAMHYAARDGFTAAALALADAGLSLDVPTAGDGSSPMVVAIINGQYDLALTLLARGANPNLTNDDGVGPLFATLNHEWALRTWYPQPTAGAQQRASYLDVLETLLKAGADPNARTRTHIWYAAYNTGRMGVDFGGATPFWRAAYSLDVDAMKLLARYGADPTMPTMSYGALRRDNDPSGLPAIAPGGPHVPPFHAASGVGYGTSRVAQQHRHVPDGWTRAAKYFIEELGVDVNQRDADGFTALHHAASRGDNETILYLVGKGADVMAVNRAGQTTVDMANSPEQRTQPYPETIALLEKLGAKNNNNCRACK